MLNEVKVSIQKAKNGEYNSRKPYVKQTAFQRTTQLLEPIPSTSLYDDPSNNLATIPEHDP